MGLYLNVGSGQRPFKHPFINVDVQQKWEPDVVADASDMPMFDTGSASIIVLHHVLEHFGCGEGDAMLRECRRILVRGGSLLVFVPDLWELSSRWRAGKISTQIYMTNLYGAYLGDEADRHKWGYTQFSLIGTLTKAGFETVKRFEDRPIEGSNIARDWWILGMEAIK